MTKTISPIKAIRKYCLDCGNDSANEVKLCPCTDCALYPFRFGKNPFSNRGKNLTEQQKYEIGQRLSKAKKTVAHVTDLETE